MEPVRSLSDRPTIPITDPAGHSCRWEVAGHPVVLTVWTLREWAALPVGKRPAAYQSLGAAGFASLVPEAYPPPEIGDAGRLGGRN